MLWAQSLGNGTRFAEVVGDRLILVHFCELQANSIKGKFSPVLDSRIVLLSSSSLVLCCRLQVLLGIPLASTDSILLALLSIIYLCPTSCLSSWFVRARGIVQGAS